MDLLEALYGLFLAGAVYGGIRADLRHLHERIAQLQQTADAAHKRIDSLLMKGSA